jgi:hypothetical protein
MCTAPHIRAGMGSMTTPDAFGASVNRTLDHLEQTLPRGSTVILIGLAQGTLLYNTTHNLTHPIGTSYPALYDYLSCVGVNPCWGWLNTNATWRDATQERADQLNGEYLKLVSQRQASQVCLSVSAQPQYSTAQHSKPPHHTTVVHTRHCMRTTEVVPLALAVPERLSCP